MNKQAHYSKWRIGAAVFMILAFSLLFYKVAAGPRASSAQQSLRRASTLPDSVVSKETENVEGTAVTSAAPPTVTEPSVESPAGMPNPAAVYCTEQGGALEMRDEESGQAGICRFPNGSECEEWAFF